MHFKRSIKINVKEQKLYLLSNNRVIKEFPVSTSRLGIGNKYKSNKTPIGLHRIYSKIGKGALKGTIFVKRRKVKKASGMIMDAITSRILRLEGLQKGINKGKNVDTLKRCIYIHGTNTIILARYVEDAIDYAVFGTWRMYPP